MKFLEILMNLLKSLLSPKMGKAAETPEDLTPDPQPDPVKPPITTENPEKPPEPASLPDEVKGEPVEEEPPVFKKALALTLKYEGGYSNHSADPGGATNKGITQAVYDAYRKSKFLGIKDVRNISEEEVEDIYYKNYWLAGKCNEMPDSLATVHFDTAVNSGIRQASKFLQRALDVVDDGVIGAKTIAKLQEVLSGKGELSIVKNYLEQRRAFFKLIVERKPSLQVFLKGWLNRVASLENYIDSETRLA